MDAFLSAPEESEMDFASQFLMLTNHERASLVLDMEGARCPTSIPTPEEQAAAHAVLLKAIQERFGVSENELVAINKKKKKDAAVLPSDEDVLDLGSVPDVKTGYITTLFDGMDGKGEDISSTSSTANNAPAVMFDNFALEMLDDDPQNTLASKKEIPTTFDLRIAENGVPDLDDFLSIEPRQCEAAPLETVPLVLPSQHADPAVVESEKGGPSESTEMNACSSSSSVGSSLVRLLELHEEAEELSTEGMRKRSSSVPVPLSDVLKADLQSIIDDLTDDVVAFTSSSNAICDEELDKENEVAHEREDAMVVDKKAEWGEALLKFKGDWIAYRLSETGEPAETEASDAG